MNYHEINVCMDDDDRAGTWSLDDILFDARGNEVEAWKFGAGERWVGHGPLRVQATRSGEPLEWDMLGYQVPIVNRRVFDLVEALLPPHTQVLPVLVGNGDSVLEYALVNVLQMPECLDIDRSQFTHWEEDEREPWSNPLGHVFIRAVLRKKKVKSLHFFRVRHWGLNGLFVSGKVRQALAKGKVFHLEFTLAGLIDD